MRRRRILLAGMSVLVASSVGVALGAPLGVGSARLGGGSAAVSPCDPDGFTYSFTTASANVTSVTVGDIADPGCEGGVLRLTLTGAGGATLASAGPGTVPSDADTAPASMTLATDAAPAASAVAMVHASLEGP